jgi:hypothetical protein
MRRILAYSSFVAGINVLYVKLVTTMDLEQHWYQFIIAYLFVAEVHLVLRYRGD